MTHRTGLSETGEIPQPPAGLTRTISGLLVAIATFFYVADRVGAFHRLDDAIVEARMAAASREATGNIVFVGIDSRSLRETGTWPWPRETYGEMIAALTALGATDIFIDIDFSARSNVTSDALFSRALRDAGGLVILPVFRQMAGVGASSGETVLNEPIPAFRDHAWLASANFLVDKDGHVRQFPWGMRTDRGGLPSVPSALSGISGPVDDAFAINFSIDPQSVPTYSAADLLDSRLTRSQIDGRSVVIGGHAAEFSDALAVPVHGIVDGVMLQILATETLLQDIVPTPLRPLPWVLATLVLGLCFLRSPIGRHPLRLVASLVAAAAVIEGAAFLLQTGHAVVLHTAVLHATLAGFAVASLLREYVDRYGRLEASRQESQDSREVLARFVNDSSDGVIVTDASGAILEINAEGRSIFDLEEDWMDAREGELPEGLKEIVAATVRKDWTGDTDPGPSGRFVFAKGMYEVHLDYTATPVTPAGPPRPGTDGNDRALCCLTVRDVTPQIEQRAHILKLERFDALTGALRRDQFVLDVSLDLATVRQTIFVLNLHRFRSANKNFGREVGDAILRAFARRMRQVDDRISRIGRVGGDVLAMSVLDLDERDAQVLAMRFLAAAAEPFDVEGARVRLTIRIGLAHGRPGDEASGLLGHAELALEKAREVPGEGIRTFEASAAQGQARYLRIEHALWSAIDDEEIYLLYQPQVMSGNGRIVGAEALVRWTHPTLGAISPGEFIPIAESNGFIEPLGRWVLNRACQDALAWPDDVSVAVNVSPLQFQRGNLVADVLEALNESGLDPRRLQLEITESLFVARSRGVMDALNEFRKLGIVLALDDFGAGFSSLGYLATLPIDKLKLDRAFVRDLGHDVSQRVIVKSVISLARDLALHFICEGVETEEQCEQLVAMGCEQIQGYLFGRPMPLDAFRREIARPLGQKVVV